ncbi:Replication protein A DNA-binding subunit B [Glycine max]|nr:Replication protein A DNA-binding subunit B [Glycine max]
MLHINFFFVVMSRKENLLCELHTKKGTWKIVVRITNMWHLNKHKGRQSIEMVLMDHTGTKIGATLWQELFPEFEPKLRCGGAYVIQNVKVVDTHSDYKVSAIKYLVYFVKTTSVKEVDRPEIPPNVHAITSFADIISGVAKPDTLVDIVGVIAEVIERKIVNPAHKVTVKLRDNRQVSPQCTEYKAWFEVDCYCLTVGTVDEVMIDTPWSYDSCPYCTTTFDPLKIGEVCRSCQNHVTHTIPRYKLVVKMEQNGEKANFHFWDVVCIKIFGKTAYECRQDLIASGDEIKVFPACVDQLLGKTWDEQCISNKSAAVGAASSSQQDYHPTPSLSQSSEYDPGNVAFVTPAKRTSDQQGSSQFDSDDFTTYELSTNKHIKAK